MTDIYEYDDKVHVTVKQLRECGLEIPDGMPDKAFIPRHGMKFNMGRMVTDGDNCGVSFQIYVSQPFRWVEPKMELRVPDVTVVPKR